MIEITQTADEASRSPDRPAYYDAICRVDGVIYTARARYGAPYDIARQLVAAGIADQPVDAGGVIHPSLHKMALRTVEEGPTMVVHSRKWNDPAERLAILARRVGGTAILSTEAIPDGSLPLPAEMALKWFSPRYVSWDGRKSEPGETTDDVGIETAYEVVPAADVTILNITGR